MTINKTPITPKRLGNSCKIKGEVISKNAGVKDTIGKTKERGDSFIAFKKSKPVTVFKTELVINTSQKVLLTCCHDLVNTTIGNKIKREKNREDHAAERTFIFNAPLLAKTLLNDSNSAFSNENGNHIMT